MLAKHFDTDLMNPPKTVDPVDVFEGDKLEPLLVAIESQANSLVLDPTTTKGIAEIKSIAAKISKHKVAIDNAGKDYVAELKDRIKPIDAKRKEARDRLDALKEKIRKPVTEMEKLAKAQKAEATNAINRCEQASGIDADDIRAEIVAVRDLKGDFGEYNQDVINAKNAAIVRLSDALSIAEQREEEYKAQMEQERQAKEAEKERQLKEQAEREAQQKIEEAERKAKEAEQKAELAAEAERQRIANEQARAEQERLQREADEANRQAKYKAIVAHFVFSGVPEQNAQWVASEIFNGNVPHVKVEF